MLKKINVGKANYIEVYSESDSDDGDEEQVQVQMHQTIGGESSHPKGKSPTLASMSRFHRYYTFRVRGVITRHKVTILVDNGASHNT